MPKILPLVLILLVPGKGQAIPAFPGGEGMDQTATGDNDGYDNIEAYFFYLDSSSDTAAPVVVNTSPSQTVECR